MSLRSSLMAGFAVALVAASAPAGAVTNLIKNGSFESGFSNWTKVNVPTDSPAIVLNYGVAANYPTGAYGEAVTADDVASFSPDAVGTQAAYFSSDFASGEGLQQLTYLAVGNYRIGFDGYLTANGLANAGNGTFTGSIIQATVAQFDITGNSLGQTWISYTGVANISKAGYYNTTFSFSANSNPSKDIVIDRVYAIATTDAATVFVPPTPTLVPEPAIWGLMVVGFGLVGASARRRKGIVTA